ncbi:MAG: protein-disulfide reductase DsbD family protein, partial [Planctomycetota bacterium]
MIDAPPGLIASTPIFPEPHEILFGAEGSQKLVPVFSDRTVIYLPMAIPVSASPGQFSIQIKVGYQACDDKVCLQPEFEDHTVTLDITDNPAAVQHVNEELFADLAASIAAANIIQIDVFGAKFPLDTSNLLLVWLVSAIGGFLLNLTPCVLPLIPIKIMGLARTAGSRSKTLFLGAVMSIGVVAFWLTLVAAIALVSGFTAANQLFQFPAFTISAGVIIALMGLGMLGMFTTTLPQWIYRFNPKHDSVHGSLGFGVMTAVLSTPCTAPMMGATAAWAALQSPFVTLSTFAAIGAGMATPYLLLAAFPQVVERMPKAGPASELIKQVMGLLMLAAAAYFLGAGLSGATATPPDPPSRLYWWVVGIASAAAGAWLIYRTLQITPAPGKRIVFSVIGLFFITTGLVIGQHFSRESPVNWVYYTPERLDEAQSRGDVVVLEFTAEWCLNCKALEESVLHTNNVVQSLNTTGVTPIKID